MGGKWTPGLEPTPWRASFHHWYEGRPSLGDPEEVETRLDIFSSRVKELMRDATRSLMLSDVSHTL